jgi:hypothetical protein
VSVRVCTTGPQPEVGCHAPVSQLEVPPLQAPKPLAIQEYVQPEKFPSVPDEVGMVSGSQLVLFMVVPSERWHCTARLRVASAEQIELHSLHGPAIQAKLHISVSSVLCSVGAVGPQEYPLVGVQTSVDPGCAAPPQLASATVVPSDLTHRTLRDCVALSASGTQLPPRVCSVTPQPELGDQEVYCHIAVPPLQAPHGPACQP